MITCISERDNGQRCPIIEQELTVNDGLNRFIEHEVGFGAQIVGLTPISVVTHTRGSGSIDLTTFRGSEEEMWPFVAFASLTLRFQGVTRIEIVNTTIRTLRASLTRSAPSDIGLLANHFVGRITAQSILYSVLQLDAKTTELDIQTLITLFQWMLETGMTGPQLLEFVS